MQKHLLAIIVGLGLRPSACYLLVAKTVVRPRLNSRAPYLMLMAQCRCRRLSEWVFVGAPLTPEGLNDGKYNCNAAGTNVPGRTSPNIITYTSSRKTLMPI